MKNKTNDKVLEYCDHKVKIKEQEMIEEQRKRREPEKFEMACNITFRDQLDTFNPDQRSKVTKPKLYRMPKNRRIRIRQLY